MKFTIADTCKIDLMLTNLRLHIGLPLMDMGVWWLWSVSSMIFSSNKSNRMGESQHP